MNPTEVKVGHVCHPAEFRDDSCCCYQHHGRRTPAQETLAECTPQGAPRGNGFGRVFRVLLFLALTASGTAQPYLHAPSVDTCARHGPQGLTILSNGRHLKPAGRPLPVGRFPYGLANPYALAVVGDTVYAANIGLFEYSPIGVPKDDRFDKRGLTFPPYGYSSAEARDGVEFEGRQIPGLGEPNVPESFSVWGVDVSNPQSPKVVSRLKTGLLVGAASDNGKTVGGSAPNFLAAHGGALFVSHGNNDIIERIDLAKNRIVAKQGIDEDIRPVALKVILSGLISGDLCLPSAQHSVGGHRRNLFPSTRPQ